MIDFLQSDAGIEASVSGVITLAAIFIAYWLQGRAQLIAFSPNSTAIPVDLPPQGGQPLLIQSGQVVLQNQGRQPAEEVEVIASQGAPPAGYKVVPYVGHVTAVDHTGRWKVVFPFIAPKEVVTIQILNGAPIENIRSKSGPTTVVPVTYQRIFPFWFNGLAAVLFFIGLFSTTYWMIRLLALLAPSA